MKLHWTPAARLELEEAVAWYETQAQGLGDKLLGEVVMALALIERFPDAWHPLSPRSRSHRLNRFPYGVIYAVTGEELQILAFAHQHRKPMYWRDRLDGPGH